MLRFLILISAFICTNVFAFKVSGKVFSTTGKPIENVVVSTPKKAVVTNHDGVFYLRDLSEDDKVAVHKIGFENLFFSAEKFPKNIVLRQRSVEIQGIKVFEQSPEFRLPESSDKIVITLNEGTSSQNIAEILSNRADLILGGTNLHGETQNITLPGYQSRHTLVMLDGIPLNKNGESFDIASIPTDIIQSIEIVKGSSGAIAGSGGMGAVININTKSNSEKFSTSYKYQFGSFGLDRHSCTFSGRNSNLSGYLFLSKSFSRNDFQYKGHKDWSDPDSLRTREFNDKKIYDISLNLLHSNKYLNSAYKLVFQDYFKKLPGSILNPDYFKNSRQTGQTYRHFVEFSRSMRNYNLQVNLYYFDENSTYDNTRLDSLYNTLINRSLGATEQIIRGAKFVAEHQQPGFYLDWGTDYKYESFSYDDKLDAASSISTKILEDYGVFGNTRLERYTYPSRLELNASARWDHTNRYTDFTSWKVASQYTFETMFDIIFGGNVANAFSYPSFLSIYWKGDTQATGNPNLKIEESFSWQLYNKLDFGNHFIKASYRQDKLKNMIVWFLEFNSKWKPDNIGKAEINTWDFETEFEPFSFLKINGMYTLVAAKNKTRNSDLYDEDIIYTPQNKLNLKALISLEQFSGILSYNRTGVQTFTPDQLSEDQLLPAYELVNVSAGYKIFWRSFELNLGVKANNVFDKLYEVYEYIPQPGFNWDVNFRVKWEI